MLDTIKHITDDNFFFQEDSAQVHCVRNTIQVTEICDFCFHVLPGSAEAQVIWGGIVRHLLIAYFMGNISAKKISKSIHVRQRYSKSKVGRFFETWCTITQDLNLCIQLLHYRILACGSQHKGSKILHPSRVGGKTIRGQQVTFPCSVFFGVLTLFLGWHTARKKHKNVLLSSSFPLNRWR